MHTAYFIYIHLFSMYLSLGSLIPLAPIIPSGQGIYAALIFMNSAASGAVLIYYTIYRRHHTCFVRRDRIAFLKALRATGRWCTAMLYSQMLDCGTQVRLANLWHLESATNRAVDKNALRAHTAFEIITIY